MRELVVPKQARLGSKNNGFRALVCPRREREHQCQYSGPRVPQTREGTSISVFGPSCAPDERGKINVSKDSVVLKVSVPFILVPIV